MILTLVIPLMAAMDKTQITTANIIAKISPLRPKKIIEFFLNCKDSNLPLWSNAITPSIVVKTPSANM